MVYVLLWLNSKSQLICKFLLTSVQCIYNTSVFHLVDGKSINVNL